MQPALPPMSLSRLRARAPKSGSGSGYRRAFRRRTAQMERTRRRTRSGSTGVTESIRPARREFRRTRRARPGSLRSGSRRSPRCDRARDTSTGPVLQRPALQCQDQRDGFVARSRGSSTRVAGPSQRALSHSLRLLGQQSTSSTQFSLAGLTQRHTRHLTSASRGSRFPWVARIEGNQRVFVDDHRTGDVATGEGRVLETVLDRGRCLRDHCLASGLPRPGGPARCRAGSGALTGTRRCAPRCRRRRRRSSR